MVQKKITELPVVTSLDVPDLLVVDVNGTNETSAIDVSDLATALGALLITAAAPANVTKDAAAAGVSDELARADHKHDVTTAAAGAITIGASAAEGVATSLARSDHAHSLAAPAAPANVTKDTAAAGASTAAARADHKHDVTTAAPSLTTGTRAYAEGNASSLARSNHEHDLGPALVDYLTTSGALPEADVVFVDTTSGAVTVTLPDPPPNSSFGRTYTIKKTNTGANKITLDPGALVAVEGAAVGTNVDLPGSTGTDRPSWTIVFDPNVDDGVWWIL